MAKWWAHWWNWKTSIHKVIRNNVHSVQHPAISACKNITRTIQYIPFKSNATASAGSPFKNDMQNNSNWGSHTEITTCINITHTYPLLDEPRESSQRMYPFSHEWENTGSKNILKVRALCACGGPCSSSMPLYNHGCIHIRIVKVVPKVNNAASLYHFVEVWKCSISPGKC